MKNALLAIGAVAFVATVAIFALSSEKPASVLFFDQYDEIERAYFDYILEYGRQFDDKTDYAFRLATFALTYKKREAKGLSLSFNKFADITNEEFKKYLGFIPTDIPEDAKFHVPGFSDDEPIDWREEGVVGPIKD